MDYLEQVEYSVHSREKWAKEMIAMNPVDFAQYPKVGPLGSLASSMDH